MKLKILLACVIAALITAYIAFDLGQYFSLDYLKQQKEALNQLYSENPLLLIIGFFVGYVLITALALPAAAILTVAAGAIFGLVTGVIIVSFASSLGATIAFLLTRYLFHDSVQSKFGDRLTAVNEGIEKEGAFYVFGMRLVPLFPFFMINSLLALTKIKVWTFYWASQLGMLAGTFVYVNAGTQLAKIQSLGDIANWKLGLSFVLLGVFPILAKHSLNLLKRNKSQPEA